MHSETRIWRTAFRLVHRYGDDAGPRTARRLLRQLKAGDLERQRTWIRLLDAVTDLQDAIFRGRRPH